ncbi:MAG: UDP-glucose--hexose-1-phosphate uridylyltransferase [Trueperaceae bacterium]|nr:UDP-glucose--hexose-1-phosphate uridylyltransferase [Trueperaceae bacterium]
MTPFDPDEHPHRRRNPLTGEAVVVSPHRTKRPWQGRQEAPAPAGKPRFDPSCYLCPGNERAGGERTPDYDGTFVFTNDFPALMVDAPEPGPDAHPLLQREGLRGTCQVICFSPRHDLTLAEFPRPALRRVVDLWAERAEALGRTWRWVQIFENKGEAMGASNPHPHGQIWAVDRLPSEAAKEDAAQRAWLHAHGEPLLVAYQRLERDRDERVVSASAHWLAVVPWWAVWPFEILITPVRPVGRLPELTDAERDDLAALLSDLLPRLDALFDTPFPYSMGWHGAPSGPQAQAEADAHWQLHAHLYPPLLRSATVRKFMVGFELLGEPQRDLTPEQAAARLRELTPAPPDGTP